MPGALFVDSDPEEGDYDSDNDSGEGRRQGGSDDDGGSEDGGFGDASIGGAPDEDEDPDQQTSSKKRKSSGKKDQRKSKKQKKLGPKDRKGSDQGSLTPAEVKELTAKEYAKYSNLYNVQIEEVLAETEIPEKRKEQVLKWVGELKEYLTEGLHRSKKFLVKDYPKILSPVELPLPKQILPGDDDGDEDHRWEWMKTQTLRWLPPTAVDVRGSWETDTALNKVSALDIFVEIPYDYLVKSDTLNHKYHLKRAIYLGYLAKKLGKRGDVLKFTFEGGDRLKPVISLQVQRVQVLIHAVPPRDYFSGKKLACDKNNLRFEHLFNEAKPEDEPESSTQHYNFTILQDALSNEVNEEISIFLSQSPNVQSAIKLIKIWLTQRELSKGYGAFSGFLVSQFARYLHKLGRITDSMPAFQMIRVFFINLIQTDLTESGISFCSDSDMIRLAHMQWDVVFLDSSGHLNFTANMTKLTYKRVQTEARRALAIIDDGNVAGFSAMFLTKVKFMLNFDHVIRLTKHEKLTESFQNQKELQSSILDHSGDIYPLIVSRAGSLIEKCLSRRITMLDTQIPEIPEWDVNSPNPLKLYRIRFGLNINREVAQKPVETSESDNEQIMEEFKSFWGNKSELRRFRDGTLLESVQLDNLVQGLGRSRICFQMLHYIFKKHLSYKLSKDEYIDRQLEALLENQYLKVKPSSAPRSHTLKKIYLGGKLAKKKMVKEVSKPEVVEQVSVDQVCRDVSSSFDELSRILRMLEELPLQISSVQGTSSTLRFSHIQPSPPQTYFQCKILTEVDPKKKALLLKRNEKIKNVHPVDDEVVETEKEAVVGELAPTKLPKYVEPVCVIIHLETSGKWPDNMEAIERLKCAFLLKIGELLGSKFGLTVQPYPKHLDILKDGFVFRIRITYFRELTLLRELRGPDGILRIRDSPESLRLEKEALILPQLTSTLHSFHLQYEAFGATCRLAKRWIASQLLLSSPLEHNRNLEEFDCRFSEEGVEILVASLFLNYAPHLNFPSEGHVGFQRFLNMLANTDFRSVPAIVNFNEKMTSSEMSAIELEFVKMRTTLPSLFISVPFDQRGSVWTRHLSPVILGRAQLLAKQALSVMETQFERVSFENSLLMKIFRAATNQFDVIIKLRKKLNPRAYQNMEETNNPTRFHEYTKKVDEMLPVVEFDPVQLYLQELRNAFGHLALFLHDTFGGQYIAVVWKPEIFKATSFTGTNVKGRQLGKKSDSIVVNVSGALEAFELLGNGLVEEVKGQSENWKFDE